MTKMASAFHFAHQANIERYHRILQTHLTAQERAFIERRLQEEHAALADLSNSDAGIDPPDHAA